MCGEEGGGVEWEEEGGTGGGKRSNNCVVAHRTDQPDFRDGDPVVGYCGRRTLTLHPVSLLRIQTYQTRFKALSRPE